MNHEFSDDFDIILGRLYTYIHELDRDLFLSDEIDYEISYPKISYIFIKLRDEVKSVVKEYKNIYKTLDHAIYSHNKYIFLLYKEIYDIGKTLKDISSNISIYNFPYIGKEGIIDMIHEFDIMGDTLLSLKGIKPKPPPSVKLLFRNIWGPSKSLSPPQIII
jgi:hypothetical protein